MSAPTSGSAGGSPTPGFYPDPSIPGYIRYWNGAAWVPGTSRPAPAQGEAMPAPPPGAAPPSGLSAPPAQGAPAPAVEETGPVFFDEEDADRGSALPVVRRAGEVAARPGVNWDETTRLHGAGPEAGASWQADASRQGGFAGESEPRVSWGSPDQAPPGTPSGAPGWGGVPPQREEPSGAQASAPDAPSDGTVAIRAVDPARRGKGAGDQGTTAIRAVRPESGEPAGAQETMTFRTAPGDPTVAAAPGDNSPQALPSVGAAPQPQRPAPQQQASRTPAPQTPAQQTPATRAAAPAAGFPAQGGAAQAGPAAQSGEADGVIPWKPPAAADPFYEALQAAQGHPAGLGRRFAARLIDTLVLGAVTAAVAVPLWGTVTDHLAAKVEAAKQSGRQVTVYLIDGTTIPVFATILAVLLLGGALLEALPTLKWGRTLGKKLCGVRVLDIESHDTPTLGAALKRWFVYGVLGVLAVGVLNAAWCLFDRPWRQCWHDKVARTFVAAG
ncbi:RDD family protein [Streptomyces kronopolitis]|uniref:RDD family protein n=1 Tax=Streptomyces kronopolitis TaxID=1612435 RepID=UPI003686DF39